MNNINMIAKGALSLLSKSFGTLVGRFSQSEGVHGSHWPPTITASLDVQILSDWLKRATSLVRHAAEQVRLPASEPDHAHQVLPLQ